MGSLRKTFYWYFPKRLRANYLVLILQSWECFFCNFHGRTGNNILQVTGSNIVSSNHFIMQYFFIRPAGPITASSEVRGHIFLYCRIFFFFLRNAGLSNCVEGWTNGVRILPEPKQKESNPSGFWGKIQLLVPGFLLTAMHVPQGSLFLLDTEHILLSPKQIISRNLKVNIWIDEMTS